MPSLFLYAIALPVLVNLGVALPPPRQLETTDSSCAVGIEGHASSQCDEDDEPDRRDARRLVPSPASWGQLTSAVGDIDGDGYEDYSTTSDYAAYDQQHGYVGPPFEIRSAMHDTRLALIDELPFVSGTTSFIVAGSPTPEGAPQLLATGVLPGELGIPALAAFSPETGWKPHVIAAPAIGRRLDSRTGIAARKIDQFGRSMLCHLASNKKADAGLAVGVYSEGRRRCTLIGFNINAQDSAIAWGLQWSERELKMGEPRAVAALPDIDGDDRQELVLSIVAPAGTADQRSLARSIPVAENEGGNDEGYTPERPTLPGVYVLSGASGRVLEQLVPPDACGFFGSSLSFMQRADGAASEAALLAVGCPTVSESWEPRCSEVWTDGTTGAVYLFGLPHFAPEGRVARGSERDGDVSTPTNEAGLPIPGAFGSAVILASVDKQPLLLCGDPRVPINGSVTAIHPSNGTVRWTATGNEGADLSPSSDYRFGSRIIPLHHQGQLVSVLIAARNPTADSGRLVLLSPATGQFIRELAPSQSRESDTK